jgi:oligosaccharide repeat unit polymerase
LRVYLGDDDLIYVQILNGLGAICLCLGILLGSAPTPGNRAPRPWLPTDEIRRRLAGAAVVIGLIGLTAYLYMLANVGGFGGAYGQAYGGVWADTGYIRDLQYLTVTALVLLLAACTGRHPTRIEWIWILLFASPWLIHGLLGARRGPTFMVLVAFCAGWYFMRFRRPRLTTTMIGGLLLGLLLLFLVAHRDQISLGSDFAFEEDARTFAFEAESGNEFLYGAGAILHADASGAYWWGRRYLTMLFVRPVPRFLWPSKYDDAAALLGTPSIETNMGVGTDVLHETVGWIGATGAAPGLVADMWIEFWWASFLAILLIGWCYGRAWSKAVTRGGIWVALYCLMFSVSIFLVMQSLEAMLFRFLLLAVPSLFAWWYARSPGMTVAVPDRLRLAISGGPR